MPSYSVWILGAQHVAISGGGSLSGITQGDGSHLVGRTLTLTAPAWQETPLTDNDGFFDDNDTGATTGQRLEAPVTIGATTFATGTAVEAEYRLTLEDPSTGQTWQVIGYNLNNSSPSYATVEALAFIGPPAGWPPVGTPLQVIAAFEGPGSAGQPAQAYDGLVSPPCFTAGTLIDTPRGPRPVGALGPGELINTRDAGPQPLRGLARTPVSAAQMRRAPAFRPVLVRRGAFGPDLPRRDMLVSQQHRFLFDGPRAELLFGAAEVLVAAVHLVDGTRVRRLCPDNGITYLHLVFDAHQIVRSDGVDSESFLVGADTLRHAPPALAAELRALVPGAAARPARPARPALRRWEARMLAA